MTTCEIGDHANHLPVAWTTLYALTKLTDEQFENPIKSGAINPQTQRKDVNELRERCAKTSSSYGDAGPSIGSPTSG